MAPPPLPEPAGAAIRRYLRLADRLLPGRVMGCYVVGSIALGAYRPDRSDIDLLLVVDRRLERQELRGVRRAQLLSAAVTTPPAVARRLLSLPGTVNATYVAAADLTAPVTAIVPVCTHVGPAFRVGAGFDVNPVQWKTLADRGIAVRGAAPASLGLDTEPGALVEWNRRNLHGYWKPWAERLLRKGPPPAWHLTPRRVTAWGVLGAPRLHRTITTGEVVSKEAAGEHALEAFDERWHPIVREGLAYWRGRPSPSPGVGGRSTRWSETGEFVLEVVRSSGPRPEDGN